MRMYDLIVKKRNAQALTEDEICFMIKEYTAGRIPDYQMSAMMMAVYFNKMNEAETHYLTQAMVNSGDVIDLSGIPGIKVDKHSTGGVGDKTSLALAPMVAACGVKVAKMSGRGLGHTGGTIDKLESFSGFSVDITMKQFMENVNRIGIAIMGQTKDLAPADKKLYALRDVTGTVDEMSLIASSIMSKKLAAGGDAIVLDVKTGSGAFMKEEASAVALAQAMLKIGKNAGKETIAVVSEMDQPLGFAVGNALEVKEAVKALNGQGPEDFMKLCYTLGSYMLLAGGAAQTEEEAEKKLREVIDNREALHKFAEFIEAQGGDPDMVYHPERLPMARYQQEVKAQKAGYVSHIDCDEVGICTLLLGGGRETKESTIDLSVGIELVRKCGDQVKNGEVLAILHGNDDKKLETVRERLAKAYHFSQEEPLKKPFIKKILK